ncbi:MAG TPA: hypothetical protein VIY69_13550 [Candidatus Acidoferrales bacterium]
MTGKGYYITTVGDWKKRAGSFTNSHWLLLEAAGDKGDETEEAGARRPRVDESSRILVLVEADEGTHAALEDDRSYEALPHPLSQKPISEGAQLALAGHGVASGASTFEATEIVSRVHPLLRHRVF